MGGFEINGHKRMTSLPASQRRSFASEKGHGGNRVSCRSAAASKNMTVSRERQQEAGRVFISLRAPKHFPKASIGGSAEQMRRTLKTRISGLDEFRLSSIQHLNSSHSETQQQLQRKTNKRCWQTESCVL